MYNLLRPVSAKARCPQHQILIFQGKKRFHLGALRAGRTISAVSLSPNRKVRAFRTKLFPAPVSPVSTFMPGENQFHVLNEGQITDAQIFQHIF